MGDKEEVKRFYYPHLVGNVERRMCGTKSRHSTKEIANRIKKIMQRKEHGTKFNVYQCPFCHFWHVGRASKEKKDVGTE